MKNLAFISVLITSIVVFPTLSFAEWRKLSSNDKGSYYIHIESIRKTDGYVYYWELGDLFKPIKNSGILSVKTYNQADCKKFRINRLTFSFYKEPLGKGSDDTFNPETEWLYPPPDSSLEEFLKFACEFVK